MPFKYSTGDTALDFNSAEILEGGVECYGEALVQFAGRGTLLGESDRRSECQFRAAQLRNGAVLLLCVSAFNPRFVFDRSHANVFLGTTNDGHDIRCEGLFETNYLPHMLASAVYGAYWCRSLDAGVEDSHLGTVRYGLTNYLFSPNAVTSSQTGKLTDVLSGYLPARPTDLRFEVHPVAEYLAIETRLKTLKTIDVTSELVLYPSETLSRIEADRVATNLSYLFSLARGTKVQWVYRKCDSSASTNFALRCEHRVTKPYGGLSLINPRPSADNHDISFIRQTYGKYAQLAEPLKLANGTIDAFLDAIAEQDFLETRAAKLAIALEGLKHVFISLGGDKAEFLMPPEEFEALVQPTCATLRDVFKQHGIRKEMVQTLIGPDRVRGMNRRSFRNLLRELLNTIGLRVGKLELERFIASRNSLVHTGSFYTKSASDDARVKVPPLKTVQDEYLFMVDFLNRVFLRLLDYTGDYVCWAVPNAPEISTLP